MSPGAIVVLAPYVFVALVASLGGVFLHDTLWDDLLHSIGLRFLSSLLQLCAMWALVVALDVYAIAGGLDVMGVL